MSARRMAAVFLAAWGAIVLAGAFASTPLTVYNARVAARQAGFSGLAPMSGLIVRYIVALVLILLARRIADLIVPAAVDDADELDARRLGIVALALMGVLLAIFGGEIVVTAAYAVLKEPRALVGDGRARVRELETAELVRAVVQVVAGAVIVWIARHSRVGSRL